MTAQPRSLDTYPHSMRIPPAMKAAIIRALEKDPDRRFPTVTSFFQAFSSADAQMPMHIGMPAPVPTQVGAPIAMGHAPTPPPGYQTGQQFYGTPPQGSHTYTPQPFSQMPTPPVVEPPRKSGRGVAVVVALLGVVVLLGGVGFFLVNSNVIHVGKAAQGDSKGGSEAHVASTAPVDPAAASGASVTPTTTDSTGSLEPLALGSSKSASAFVGAPTTHNTGTAAATTAVTAPTVATAPATTATQPYTPPTYATAPPTYPTYAPTTQPTTYQQNPMQRTGPQPRECQAARMMLAQGRQAQAQALAMRCINKGGQPPF